jgi:hypothetical protein
MMFNTRFYWVFGVCPSGIVRKAKEHDISETGSVSSSDEECVAVSLSSPEDGISPFSETGNGQIETH